MLMAMSTLFEIYGHVMGPSDDQPDDSIINFLVDSVDVLGLCFFFQLIISNCVQDTDVCAFVGNLNVPNGAKGT